MERRLQQLYNWIHSDQDHAAGAALYFQYGKNANLKRQFQRPPNDYLREKLLYELNKMVGSWRPPVGHGQLMAANDQSGADRPVIDEHQPGIDHQAANGLPAPLKQAWKELLQLYRTRDRLHAQLSFYTSNKRRFKAQQTMIDAQRRIIDIWAAIDYFREHKILLPEYLAPAEAATAGQVQKRKTTVRTYISRYKNAVKKSDKMKLEKYKSELLDLERQLGEAEFTITELANYGQ